MFWLSQPGRRRKLRPKALLKYLLGGGRRWLRQQRVARSTGTIGIRRAMSTNGSPATRSATRTAHTPSAICSHPRPIRRTREIAVLDVGGGYGVVTEEVLRAFPRAKRHLAGLFAADARSRETAAGVAWRPDPIRGRRFARAGLGPAGRRPVRSGRLGDRHPQSARSWAIAACYRAIAGLVKADGVFLDYDLFDLIGGLDQQLRTIEEAGFAAVGCIWQQPPLAIIRAREPRGASLKPSSKRPR